jgi:hypothetical protein
VNDRDAFGNTINSTGEAMTAALPRPAAPPTVTRGSWDLWDKAAGLFLVLLFVVPFAVGGWFALTTLHDARSTRIDVPALVHTAPSPASTPPKPHGLGALRPTAVQSTRTRPSG